MTLLMLYDHPSQSFKRLHFLTNTTWGDIKSKSFIYLDFRMLEWPNRKFEIVGPMTTPNANQGLQIDSTNLERCIIANVEAFTNEKLYFSTYAHERNNDSSFVSK